MVRVYSADPILFHRFSGVDVENLPAISLIELPNLNGLGVNG
jgi:hypothetical protein